MASVRTPSAAAMAATLATANGALDEGHQRHVRRERVQRGQAGGPGLGHDHAGESVQAGQRAEVGDAPVAVVDAHPRLHPA